MAPRSFLTLCKNAVGIGEPQPPPPPLVVAARFQVGANENVNHVNDNDNGNEGDQTGGVDAEKHAANTTQSETGLVGIQAAQAIWGKHGRWLTIAGYIKNIPQ
jgi:hypothetical protein